MGKYWVVLVMGWMTLAAAGEKADESLAGKDPNQVEAGEKEAENTGAAQAQPGDANKRLKKTDRMEEKFSVRELLERYAANQKLALLPSFTKRKPGKTGISIARSSMAESRLVFLKIQNITSMKFVRMVPEKNAYFLIGAK